MSKPAISKILKNVLRFTVSFGLAFGLFWYLYGSDFPSTLNRLSEVNFRWILLSLGLGLISHWFRARRWKLLLKPTGHNPTLLRTITALFLGYFANLALPRLGEVTRCLTLRRTDNIPVTTSFGTVVTERLLDLLCLMVVVVWSLIIEYEKLNEFFSKIILDKLAGLQGIWWPLVTVGVTLLLLVGLIWWRFQQRLKATSWWKKFRYGLRELWGGLTSVVRVKEQFQLWFSTIMIWVLYYLMAFVVFYSMDMTADLGWQAGLSLLVMGGLAMSAPVQGGLGAYHYLVSALLIYYGISRADGLFFAFLLHASQTVLIILLGLIALVVFMGTKKPYARNAATTPEEVENI